MRNGRNRDLGVAPEGRKENIRRIGEVAKLCTDAGVIVLTAFISPYRDDRAQARALLPEGDFIEVHVDADLDTCESRDPKGLYKKARAGEIKGFTGIDDPYEEPKNAEVVLKCAEKSVDECVAECVEFLKSKGIVG